MLALWRALKAILNYTTSLFPKEFLIFFLSSFTVDALRRHGPGDESFFRYLISALDAYPECAIINSFNSFFYLKDKAPFSVTNSQLVIPFNLHGCLIVKVRKAIILT